MKVKEGQKRHCFAVVCCFLVRVVWGNVTLQLHLLHCLLQKFFFILHAPDSVQCTIVFCWNVCLCVSMKQRHSAQCTVIYHIFLLHYCYSPLVSRLFFVTHKHSLIEILLLLPLLFLLSTCFQIHTLTFALYLESLLLSDTFTGNQRSLTVLLN